jgi:hypothetical protein
MMMQDGQGDRQGDKQRDEQGNMEERGKNGKQQTREQEIIYVLACAWTIGLGLVWLLPNW